LEDGLRTARHQVELSGPSLRSAEVVDMYCESIFSPFSAAMLVNMPLHDFVGSRENFLKEEEIPYADIFLQQIMELAKDDKV